MCSKSQSCHSLTLQDDLPLGTSPCLCRMDTESSDELLFKDHDFSSDLLRQLNDLRQNRILTDVSICAGSWEVPCHRNVLASSSPYFRAMFCSNFRESREAKVQLKGVDASTLERIILYVYTGEAHITVESVLPLMEAASMLQYPKLLEACSSFLQNQLGSPVTWAPAPAHLPGIFPQRGPREEGVGIRQG